MEAKLAHRAKDLAQKLTELRTQLVIGLAVLVVLGEIYHHGLESRVYYLDAAFWLEIAIYGMAIPALVLIVLKQIEQRTGERDQMALVLNRQYELAEKLAQPLSWDQLVNTILTFPEKVIPSRGVYLHLHQPAEDRFQLVGSTGQMKHRATWMEENIAGSCPCTAQTAPGEIRILSCLQNATAALDRYCLPLAYGERTVGLLHFDLPRGRALSASQTDALLGAAPEIALALNNANLQRSAIAQAEAIVRDRQHIAQDLHDTLGQNIAYLRLKLDHISSANALQSIEEINREIEKMREVANEAYEQVRSTLRKLEPAPPSCLTTAFKELAEKTAARAGFHVEVSATGEPIPLTAVQQRQITYIIREALNNIEKHSGAQHVCIQIAWTPALLTWQVSDDGRGFDANKALNAEAAHEHFGLNIMHERAEQLHARLAVRSAPGRGAQVTLQLPLEAAPVRGA